MATDTRDLLAVLKAELAYLEKGGYRQTTRAVWRPHFVFQDSPACLNFDSPRTPHPCSDCVLTELVPEGAAKQKFPCRYIPLDEHGKTIDWFYRCGTEKELEAAMRRWLTQTISRLEREHSEKLRAAALPQVDSRAKSAAGR